jgi:hypothetical protein
LSDLVAHKTVYIALRTLATKFPSGEPVRIQLEQAAAAYAAEVETFIAHATQSFEQALQSDAPMLHWANPELMDAYRPKMLFLIADYLCKLSSLLRSSTSSYS